jgi:hypothetical protein
VGINPQSSTTTGLNNQNEGWGNPYDNLNEYHRVLLHQQVHDSHSLKVPSYDGQVNCVSLPLQAQLNGSKMKTFPQFALGVFSDLQSHRFVLIAQQIRFLTHKLALMHAKIFSFLLAEVFRASEARLVMIIFSFSLANIYGHARCAFSHLAGISIIYVKS